MARRKEGENGGVNAVVPVTVNLQPVKYEQPEAESVDVANLPAEWQSAETLGGFAPSPRWETPGEAMFGTFIAVRDNVGPNDSRVYEVMAHMGPDKKPELTAVWGSTALDRMFDSAFPKIKTGDKIGIIYLGEKPTKRAQNPVKLFQLKVMRPTDKGATTMGSGGADVKAKQPVDITPGK